MLNNNCRPNLSRAFSPAAEVRPLATRQDFLTTRKIISLKVSFTTTRAVEKGEELSICYTGSLQVDTEIHCSTLLNFTAF